MAKPNKYKHKHKTSVNASTAVPAANRASKPSPGDAEVHVNMTSTDTGVKGAAAVPSGLEAAAAPVVQDLPAQSTVETYAEPLLDNSSYATADSEEPLSTASTPPGPAGAPDGVTKDEPVVPRPAFMAAAVVAPAETAEATTPAAVAVPVPPPVEPPVITTTPAQPALPADSVPAAAVPDVVVAPAAAAPAAPVTVADADADASNHDVAKHTVSEHSQLAAPAAAVLQSAAHWLDWLVRAYTYPVYLTAGATVGLVNGVLDQLPGHSSTKHN